MKREEKNEKVGKSPKSATFRDLGEMYPPKPLKKHYHSKVLRRGGRKGALFTKRGGKLGNVRKSAGISHFLLF